MSVVVPRISGYRYGASDNAHQAGQRKGNDDPDDGDNLGFFQFVLILDRHKTDEDMRHSEIAESPGQLRNFR